MRIPLSLFKQLIFLLIVFAVERAIFLLYYRPLLMFDEIGFIEASSVFYHALKLDVSTASYILILPMVLMMLQLYGKPKFFEKALLWYYGQFLFIYLLIASGEMGLYGEWKSKLSTKALLYLKQPMEVIQSVSTSEFIGLWVLVIGQWFLFFFLFKRFVQRSNGDIVINRGWKPLTGALVCIPLIFIGIRGGLGQIPITTSQSYFSKHNILNASAVNVGYNLAFSVLNHAFVGDENIFKTMEDSEARKLVDDIHHVEKDTTLSILNTTQPNILIIMLESWSGDLVESLGGLPGITPEFRKLEQEGLLFTNYYASGNRSQQAMASLYAGFPGLPVTTLTNHPEKYSSVPSMVKQLNEAGYYTSFHFGGELNYGNIKSYLIANEFDNIVEGKDIDSELPRGKLGLHDGYLFDVVAKDLNAMQKPFFATAFTLSSHAPYDQPGDRPIDWIDLERNFVNSAHYTDRCLGDFFNQIKKEEWYRESLIFVFADHSHNSYKNFPLTSFDYHRVPLLITGGALKDSLRGKQMETIVSNVDLTKTILHQLGLPSRKFPWSKDIFNPYTPQFAFFELGKGFGWKKPEGEIVVNIFDNHYYIKNVPDELRLQYEKEGKAYIQLLFEEFLTY